MQSAKIILWDEMDAGNPIGSRVALVSSRSLKTLVPTAGGRVARKGSTKTRTRALRLETAPSDAGKAKNLSP